MHEGDFSCEQTGEYGSLGGYKWKESLPNNALLSEPEDTPLMRQMKHVVIGRGCRACTYNEMSGEVALRPIPESRAARLENWRFLPCDELLNKLRSLGLAESSVVRFADALDLSSQGVPVKRDAGTGGK